MFFSVIVPIYNMEKYLRQCLDSLVNQTCTDREIILVDDGSTDASGAICDEYAQRYGSVTVIHQANQGLSGARNTGLEHAKGEWLSFIDSDDWIETDMLERVQAYILATNADAYQFNSSSSNEQGNVETKQKIVAEDTLFTFPDEQTRFRFYYSYFHMVGSVWKRVYRHSIIQKHNLRFIDSKQVYAEDKLFNFQYMLYIRTMLWISAAPYHYRIREDSLSHSTRLGNKLPQAFNLVEHTYQSVVNNRMTYFQQNFHYLYFKIINLFVLRRVADLSDVQMRKILDKMCEHPFHRHNIKKIRKDKHLFIKQTNGRVWFSKRFGRKGNIKYTLKHYINKIW